MHTFDRLWRSQRGLVGGLVVALILAVGTLAPAIAPYSYSTQSLLTRLERPSAAHWLGTDGFGRDILTRVIWGGRVSLEIGLLATGLSVIVGTVLGGIAAYFGGAVDTAIMRIADVFMAIPALFLILVVVALFGAGLTNTAAVIGLVTWAQVARIVRGECLSLRARDFVDAARALGASHRRILGRHVLVNALPVIIVQATLLLGQTILIESGLSYLGRGAQPRARGGQGDGHRFSRRCDVAQPARGDRRAVVHCRVADVRQPARAGPEPERPAPPRRIVGSLARRPDLHVQAQEGRPVARRQALHCARRRFHLLRCPRPQGNDAASRVLRCPRRLPRAHQQGQSQTAGRPRPEADRGARRLHGALSSALSVRSLSRRAREPAGRHHPRAPAQGRRPQHGRVQPKARGHRPLPLRRMATGRAARHGSERAVSRRPPRPGSPDLPGHSRRCRALAGAARGRGRLHREPPPDR